MMKLLELMVFIMISIIKKMSITLSMIIEILENVFELMNSVKTKTTEKILRVFVILITGKMMESMLDTKIIAIIEIVKIIVKCISITEVMEMFGLYIAMVLIMIANAVCGENGLIGNIMFMMNNYMDLIIINMVIMITTIEGFPTIFIAWHDKLRSCVQRNDLPIYRDY